MPPMSDQLSRDGDSDLVRRLGADFDADGHMDTRDILVRIAFLGQLAMDKGGLFNMS